MIGDGACLGGQRGWGGVFCACFCFGGSYLRWRVSNHHLSVQRMRGPLHITACVQIRNQCPRLSYKEMQLWEYVWQKTSGAWSPSPAWSPSAPCRLARTSALCLPMPCAPPESSLACLKALRQTKDDSSGPGGGDCGYKRHNHARSFNTRASQSCKFPGA